MPMKAKSFIALTIAAGAVLVLSCLLRSNEIDNVATFSCYCVLAMLASALKVRLPGITGTISVNFLFILIAIAIFSLPETVLLACVACIVQCVWKAKRRPKVVQVAFNVSALAIASGTSYLVAHVLAGSNASNTTLLLALAAFLYFGVNTMMISGVLSLIEGRHLWEVWQQCYLWSFPYYMVGAIIAGLVVHSNHTSGWTSSLLILPVMWLIHMFYRMCVERLTRQVA